MKVQRGNVNKYEENKHLILGIARHSDKIAVEYISHSRSGQRHTLLAHKDGIVWHTCPAYENHRPCWHLGMAAALWGWRVPADVTCHPEQKVPEGPWQDVTMNYLGRPGDFRLIPINGAVTSEVPEASPAVEEPTVNLPDDDAWLKEYKLPARLLEKVLRFREAQKARLTPDQKQRIPRPRYLPADGELVRAVAALLYGESGGAWEPPLLIGPKGSGKSTLAETLAAILHLPATKIFGGIDVNAEWLIGGKTLEPVEGVDPVAEAKLKVAARQAGIDLQDVLPKLKNATLKVAFEPGLLLKAVQDGEMVVVDEVNMLVPEVTSLLHGLLDWQKVLSVPGVGTVKAHSSFRLVGCMNYGYAGTKELNEAFQDRFRSILVPHLPEELLKDLLIRETGCGEDVAGQLAALFHKLASRVENGDLPERVLSFRALMRAIREVQDGCGGLKEVAMSVLTEGLGDQYARDQVKDIVDAYVA